METGKMINRISNRLRRRSLQIQTKLGISGAQGNVLDYILIESEKHSVYQKEIEQEFGLRPSTATELMSSMEQKGLISRIPEEFDGRYKRIVFQEKATEMKEALRKSRNPSVCFYVESARRNRKSLCALRERCYKIWIPCKS